MEKYYYDNLKNQRPIDWKTLPAFFNDQSCDHSASRLHIKAQKNTPVTGASSFDQFLIAVLAAQVQPADPNHCQPFGDRRFAAK